MGGNALKNCETRRFERNEYLSISQTVLRLLKESFPNQLFSIIVAYNDKESFGDMDVLCGGMEGGIDYKRVLRDLFDSKEVVHNGNVWSLEFNNFQIDLIFTPREEMEIAGTYFSYNDLGNFMGRIAHKMGFKYGHNGLTYQFRSMDDHIFDEFVLSKEPHKIFSFLGYDYLTYLKGFNTLEDIFKFASSTPYFHKDIFLLHNRNHVSRVRDMKRKSYNEFLKWLETYDGENAYNWDSYMEKGGRKDVDWCMENAFYLFPEFKVWYDDVKFRLEQHNLAKTLFNGNVVSLLTGLENIELGKFMQYLNLCMKIDFENKGYRSKDEFIVTEFNSKYHMEVYIMECFECFNGVKNNYE